MTLRKGNKKFCKKTNSTAYAGIQPQPQSANDDALQPL